MPTIYDIAKQAKVSVATVSKVLNGYSDVSEKTRERVLKITADEGYHRSSFGRGLATQKSWSVGIFFRDHVNSGFRHPFFHDVLASFKDEVGAAGYDIVFFSNSHLDKYGYEVKARQRNVDGLLLLGVPRTDPNLAPLSQTDIPIVSIDLDLLGSRASYLCSDNSGGAEMAVRHFASQGHTHIGFVGDKFGTLPGHDRRLGYQKSLEDLGLPFVSEWVQEANFTEEGGYTSTKQLLSRPNPPTAIFYAGDMMAIGGMKAMKDLSIVPGKDVSLIGFDDIQLAAYVTPGLTTIRQKREEMGQAAAVELVALMENENKAPSVIKIDTELVERETVVDRTAE